MNNKNYKVALTYVFTLSAPNEDKANERADIVALSLLDGSYPNFKKSWFHDDLEQDNPEVEEDE